MLGWVESKMMAYFGAFLAFCLFIGFFWSLIAWAINKRGPLEVMGFSKVDDSCHQLYNLNTRKIDCRTCKLSGAGNCKDMAAAQCTISPKCKWDGNVCSNKEEKPEEGFRVGGQRRRRR